MENTINTALEGAKSLSTLGINTRILKVVSSAEVTMLNVNNMNSESMGFDFKEQLIKIATDILVGAITEANNNSSKVIKKKRIKAIIQSVVDNEIVQGLIQSNPISSMAYSIINQAFSASETVFESGENQVIIQSGFEAPATWKGFKKKYSSFQNSWNGLGGEFKGLNQTQRIISNDAIETFTAKIKDYIDIYDSLNVINNNFGLSIKNWESKNIQIVNDASAYTSELSNSFKFITEGDNVNLSLKEAKSRSKVLLDTTNNSLKLIMGNKLLNRPLVLSDKFILLENNTNMAYLDFLNIQIRFIESYVRILNNITSKSNDNNNDFKVNLKNLKKTKSKLTKNKEDLKYLVEEFKKIIKVNN